MAATIADILHDRAHVGVTNSGSETTTFGVVFLNRQPDCGYCGSALVGDRLPVPETMFGTNQVFEYAMCTSCSSLTLIGAPHNMSPYYPVNYYSIDQDPEVVLGSGAMRKKSALLARTVLWSPGGTGLKAVRALRNPEALKLAHSLDAVRRSGLGNRRATSVLDVGSGSGFLVFLLGLGGLHDVTGVDPFMSADRVLSTGGRLLKKSLSDLTSTFDLVMFHHSFEHVPNVEDELRGAVRRLNPGGRLVIRMPTASSEAYATYGTSWFQFDAPRHFTIASRVGMGRLCSRVGLRIVSVTDDSNGIQFWRSEQIEAGFPMQDPRACRTAGGQQLFTEGQLVAWEKRATYLNKVNRGDQAAWVLERL